MEKKNFKKPRGASWAFMVNSPIPLLYDGGGLVNNFVNSKQYKAIDTSNVNVPQGTTGASSFNMGTAGSLAGAATGLLSTAASAGMQQNPYKQNLSGNSTTQQTVDSLVGMIPGVGQIYGAGKALGSVAENDYKAQNEFGELANTDKFNVADTIGMFIDPVSSFISGLSGEGWT